MRAHDPHAITNFSKGVSTEDGGNLATQGVMSQFVYPDPIKAYTYFNDFFNFTATDWTITTTEVGAGSATEVIGSIAGGVLVLTNAAGDNDLDSLQLEGESFLLPAITASKKFWFECRLKVSDATQSDFLMGLVITDTTPLTNTDGIFFIKDDGDTDLDFTSEKDSAGVTKTAIKTVVDDTFFKAGFYYDGVDLRLYIDGTLQQTIRNADLTLPDDEELTPTLHIQNGEAVAKVMTVDYILAAVER